MGEVGFSSGSHISRKGKKSNFECFYYCTYCLHLDWTRIIVLFGTQNYSLEGNTGLFSVLCAQLRLWSSFCLCQFCTSLLASDYHAAWMFVCVYEFWALICMCGLQVCSETLRLRFLVVFAVSRFSSIFVCDQEMQFCVFLCICGDSQFCDLIYVGILRRFLFVWIFVMAFIFV